MSVHNGFVRPPAIACRYCGLSPTYCTCDRFRDARVGHAFSTIESRSGGNPGEKQVRAVACHRGIHCTNSSAGPVGFGWRDQGVGLTVRHDIAAGDAERTCDSSERRSPAGTQTTPALYESKQDECRVICWWRANSEQGVCRWHSRPPISTSSSPEGRAKPAMAATLLAEPAGAIPHECAPAGIKPGLDVDPFGLKVFELFQTRKTRKGPRGASSEAPASARSTAACSRVSRAQERTGGCFL